MLKSILTSPLFSQIVMGQLRHALTTAGGSLMAAGYLTQGNLETAIGAATTLAGLVLSALAKKAA